MLFQAHGFPDALAPSASGVTRQTLGSYLVCYHVPCTELVAPNSLRVWPYNYKEVGTVEASGRQVQGSILVARKGGYLSQNTPKGLSKTQE